jgi:hypothetical protein
VLLGLLKEGFTEFVRVGSLKKIAKPILNFTLQSVDDKEAQKELQSMLRDPFLSPSEYKTVKETLESLKSGDMKKREEKLQQVRVVGMNTCIVLLMKLTVKRSNLCRICI